MSAMVQPFALVQAGWRGIGCYWIWLNRYEIVVLGSSVFLKIIPAKDLSMMDAARQSWRDLPLSNTNIAVHNGLRYVPVTCPVLLDNDGTPALRQMILHDRRRWMIGVIKGR